MASNPLAMEPPRTQSPQVPQQAHVSLYGGDYPKCELTWPQLIHAEIIGMFKWLNVLQVRGNKIDCHICLQYLGTHDGK